MTRTRYSNDFKASIVAKSVALKRGETGQFLRKHGICPSMLSDWRRTHKLQARRILRGEVNKRPLNAFSPLDDIVQETLMNAAFNVVKQALQETREHLRPQILEGIEQGLRNREGVNLFSPGSLAALL